MAILSPFAVCKKNKREEKIFREERTDWELGRTAAWLVFKDVFGELVREFY